MLNMHTRTHARTHPPTHPNTHTHTLRATPKQDMTLTPVLTVEETFTHACMCIAGDNKIQDGGKEMVSVVMRAFGV